jgi:CRISPR/Cas system CSM-associated protein Csm3 (group 7 of RAMP superfamily)
MKTTHKYLAKIVVETATPLAVGTGEKGSIVDRIVARDALDLPYIPGTTLAGVIRHVLAESGAESLVDNLFGYQSKVKKTEEQEASGQGSRIIFSGAHLIGEDGVTVIEGIQPIDYSSNYYGLFKKMPKRDHVRINEKGAADTQNNGKFDEELVHRGTRFAFSIELDGNEADQDIWQELLTIIHRPLFRIGSGTRKGFGALNVISCKTKVYNCTQKIELLDYLSQSSALNQTLQAATDFHPKSTSTAGWKHYQLNLQPCDFFLFGAGFGDEDVDNKSKTERYIDWSSGKAKLVESDWLLIPATSIKGALSHRIAFHYNQLCGNYALQELVVTSPPSLNLQSVLAESGFGVDVETIEQLDNLSNLSELEKHLENQTFDTFFNNSNQWKEYEHQLEKYQKSQSEDLKLIPGIGVKNDAVKSLFGYALKDDEGARGKVIFSDLYLEIGDHSQKVFSHVAIDRFTGGSMDGALFQQKVATSEDFKLDIYVDESAMINEKVKTAFEQALQDLADGKLPLGGSTTKGHGRFRGTVNQIN